MAETTDQYKNRISQIKTSIENEPEIVKMREDIAEGISKTGNRQADIEVRQGTLEEDFVKVQQDASSVSPSGAEVAVARGEYSTLDGRLTAEQNKVNAQLAQTENYLAEFGVNVKKFGAVGDGIANDLPAFQAAINYLPVTGGILIVPGGKGEVYKFEFETGSTILNPTRVLITKDNVRVIGNGSPLIKMVGLTMEYLNSIDDYASSGRDLFTAFSFHGVKNGRIEGIRAEGEYTGEENFRYKSPRAKVVGFLGCKDCVADGIEGKNILGNVVNASPGGNFPGYTDWVGDTWTRNIRTTNSKADHCLENGFNYMGNVWDSSIDNCFATKCANGLESASYGFTAANNILRGNKSSAMAVSGSNSTVTGNVCSDSLRKKADGTTDPGYGSGIIIGSGQNIVISGNIINGNTEFAIYLYPGVFKVTIIGNIMSYNSVVGTIKSVIHMTGKIDLKVSDVLISGNQFFNTEGVNILTNDHADRVTVEGNVGIFDTASNAMAVGSNSTKWLVRNNNFNKPVSMNQAAGQMYNNGFYSNKSEYSAAPTAGNWKVGDFVKNVYPTVKMDGSQRYMLMGWLNTTAGSPGLWEEKRQLL